MRYLRPAAAYTYEDAPIKGSRFLAWVEPVGDPDGANARMRAIADAHADWSHCCWAWRLRGGATRSWDAGEPRGSAGRPILLQIEGHAVFDVAVVVLRMFGGTKLGVGGLVRAYGGAAGMALDRAPLVEVADTVQLSIPYRYDDTQAVEACLLGAGAETLATDWGASVVRRVSIDVEREAALCAALSERTAGRVRAERVR